MDFVLSGTRRLVLSDDTAIAGRVAARLLPLDGAPHGPAPPLHRAPGAVVEGAEGGGADVGPAFHYGNDRPDAALRVRVVVSVEDFAVGLVRRRRGVEGGCVPVRVRVRWSGGGLPPRTGRGGGTVSALDCSTIQSCALTLINKTLKYAAPPGRLHPALVPSNRVQCAEDYPDLGNAVRQRAVGHDAGHVGIAVELSGGEGEVGVEIVEGGQREGGGSPGGKGGRRGGVDADG